MDDPWADFRIKSPSPEAGADDPWAEFRIQPAPATGLLSNSADDGYASGAAKGLGTAAIKGVSNALGFPTNLANFGDYLLARAHSKITGQPVDEVLAEYKKRDAQFPGYVRALDPRNVIPSGADIAAPVLKQTGEYVPTTEPGRIAQGGAEAVFSGLGPGGGGAAGAGRDILAAAPAMALGNAAAGSVGEAVTDATGDPLLGLGAGIAGAGLAQGVGTGARRAFPALGPGGAERVRNAAGQRLLDQSSDPAALRDWAAQPDTESEVPGSLRTTAGAVGNDRGLFQAEKDVRNINNIPFNERDRAQSDAQRGAIRGMQPEGDVFLPGKMIRERMDALDDAAREVEDRLSAAHQDAVTRRTMASADYADRARAGLNERTLDRGQAASDEEAAATAERQAAHDRLVQSFEAAHSAAETRAREGAGRLGERTNAEDLGGTLRSALEEVRSEVKKVHKDLYDAVDPHGNLALVASPVRDRATSIAEQIRADGSEFDPVEAGLFRRASALPDVIPYRMLHTLDKDISAAMSKERRSAGETPALARLVQLKGAVKDAMINAADNQARHEARLVDAGLMAPEDTIAANIQRWVDDHYARQDAVAASGVGSVANSGGGNAGVARASRTTSQTGVGPRGAPSIEGIPREALSPNFDEAGAQRLKDANAAYADYAQIYKNPIIAPGLRTTGYSGQYRIPDAAFIKRAVIPGEKGFEVLNAHLAAVKDNPTAVAAMQNHILDPLRRTAQGSGMIHPNALAKWKESYGPALRALERVAPGFSSNFDDAAAATQSLLDIGVQHKADLADFQKSAARQAVLDNIARREKLGQANAADRAQVKALLAERASDDAAQNAQSKAETSAGVSRARGIAKEAKQTPAGQFAAQGGDRIASTEVENAVGNLLKTGTSGATRMRSLVESVSGNPDALAGLRKAAVDWIIREHQTADGSMSGAKFINFIKNNRDTLKELFPESQISTFAAISRDIEANAKWRTETAIKGGSDTTKNIKPMLEKAIDEGKRHFSIMSAATAGFLTGFSAGGGVKGAVIGASTSAAVYLMNTLRSAGIRQIDDLYREALLNPEKARSLLMKMPQTQDGSTLQRAIGLLRRPVIVGPMLVDDRKGAKR